MSLIRDSSLMEIYNHYRVMAVPPLLGNGYFPKRSKSHFPAALFVRRLPLSRVDFGHGLPSNGGTAIRPVFTVRKKRLETSFWGSIPVFCFRVFLMSADPGKVCLSRVLQTYSKTFRATQRLLCLQTSIVSRWQYRDGHRRAHEHRP